MNVLLTGAFGNIGQSALEELLKRGHRVRCFDLRTKANEKKARQWGDRIEVVWGDLRRPEDVAVAVQGQDVVIHLAFIIPKLSATGVESESRPDWAREINVGGTRNLIEALKAQPRPPKIIFSSSIHIYGQTQHLPPPRRADEPVNPTEHYSRHKAECEQMIRESGLEWSIFRFAAALPLAIRLDPGMFDVPLNNRMEFVHTRDVGLALANGVESTEIWGKVLLIGGGPRCQYYYREIVERVLDAAGVGMLPEEAFGRIPFATDWMDTTESQRLLRYQQRDLSDYAREMAALMGYRRYLVRVFRPFVRASLLRKSPYFRAAQTRVRAEWKGKAAVVTGASGGIGAAIALRLAREGMRVALVARNRERLEALAVQIREFGGKAVVVIADLADESERVRAFEQIRAALGPVDVLVNNAGLGWYGESAEMPWSLAAQMLEVNVVALVRFTLMFLTEMRARKAGHIINIGSIAGSIPSQGVALYSATKSFVDAFTTGLHRELRGTGVRVSVVRAGAVATDFFDRVAGQFDRLQLPLKRWGIKPEVVAERVWRLLRRPVRVAYVPGVLRLVPWIELTCGWLMDRVGPLLLQRQPKRQGLVTA